MSPGAPSFPVSYLTSLPADDVEVVSFKLVPNADPASFRQAAAQAHRRIAASEGFVRRELLHDPESDE